MSEEKQLAIKIIIKNEICTLLSTFVKRKLLQFIKVARTKHQKRLSLCFL